MSRGCCDAKDGSEISPQTFQHRHTTRRSATAERSCLCRPRRRPLHMSLSLQVSKSCSWVPCAAFPPHVTVLTTALPETAPGRSSSSSPTWHAPPLTRSPFAASPPRQAFRPCSSSGLGFSSWTESRCGPTPSVPAHATPALQPGWVDIRRAPMPARDCGDGADDHTERDPDHEEGDGL